MEIIVESGATKSTWVLFTKDKVLDTQVLDGINPTSNPLSVEYVDQYQLKEPSSINCLHFYGAGVSNEAAKKALMNKLSSVWPNMKVSLNHDILAAARSISSDQASVVSILGTGTNTVVFDGQRVQQSLKALGYLFADYGSGFHIGKLVVQAYFEGKMTEEDAALFYSKYLEDQDDLMFRIYSASKPNYLTAQFTKFLEHCSEQFKERVVTKAFEAFFEKQIEVLDIPQDYRLNFVGSISMVFERYLRSVGEKRGHRIGNIVGNPIDGLVNFHQNLI